MVPAFNGLGYAMILVRFFVNIYYVVITAWALYYLAMGFQKNLPWGACDQDWNTFECYSLKLEGQCREEYGNNQTTWNRNNCTTYEQYCQNHDDRHYNVLIINNTVIKLLLINLIYIISYHLDKGFYYSSLFSTILFSV